MGTFRMAPDALLDQTGLTGSVTDIQDDPDSADGNWLTTSNNTSTVCRASFGTPDAPNNLDSTTNAQEFRVLLRKTNHSTDPTFSVDLYESGTLRVNLASGVTLSSTTGQVYSYNWTGNGTNLANLDGSNVEIRISGTPGGGSPSNRASVEVGAVEWNAVTTDPPVTETHVPPKPAYAMTPVRNDGIWSGIYRIFAVLPGAEFTEVITGQRGEPATYSNFSSFPLEETDSVFGPVVHSPGVADRILYEMSPNGENEWTSNIDPPRPSEGLTVVALINYGAADSSPAGTSIIQRYTGTTNAYPYRIYQSNGGLIRAGSNLDGTFRSTDDLLIQEDEWVWLVMRWESGKTMRFEAFDLDGQSHATEVATVGSYSNITWTTGDASPDDDYHALWGDSNGAFEGKGAAAMVWNRELTDTELAQFFSNPWDFYDPQLQTAGAAPTQINGTGAVTLGGLTVSSAGAVAMEGTGAVTLGALTVSSAGKVQMDGTGAVTLGALTVDSAGTVSDPAVTGTGAVTFGGLTVSSAGTVQVQGTGAVTFGALTVSSAGKVQMDGVGAVTLGALTVSSAGKVQMDGVGAVTLGALTVSSAGTVLVQGTGGATLGALTLDSAGTVAWQPRTGDGAVTFGALTVSSAGKVQMDGVGAITLGALATSGTGGLVTEGIGAVTFGALTVSSAGAVQVKGTGGVTLGALAISSLGDVLMQGNGNVPLGALTISSAGKVQMDGTGAVTFGALLISSTGLIGTTVTTGTGAITLGILGVDATGDVIMSGNGAVSLGGLSVASQGVVPVQGTGGALLGALAASGQGVVPMEGVGAITLGAITTYGYDERDQAGGLGYANRSINNAIGIMT